MVHFQNYQQLFLLLLHFLSQLHTEGEFSILRSSSVLKSKPLWKVYGRLIAPYDEESDTIYTLLDSAFRQG